MSSRPFSLRRRLTVAATVWCILALGAAGVLLDALFRDQIERQAQSELNSALLQLITLTRASGGSAALSGDMSDPRFQRPLSGWVWQVRRGDIVLLQSGSLGPISLGNAPLTALIGKASSFRGPDQQRLFGLARNVAPRFSADRLTFVVARNEAELGADLMRFRLILFIALAALAALQIFAVLYLMRISLRPIGDLSAFVTSLRNGEPAPCHKWPRELAPAAEELDALGSHVDRLVERGRGLAEDLAHAVKTPLTALRQQVELLPTDEKERMDAQVARIDAALDRHLARAKTGGVGRGRSSVRTALDDLEVALSPILKRRKLNLHVELVGDPYFAGDETDLYELIGNPLENACKWAVAEISVTAFATEDSIRVSIEDDGPGVPAEERERIFERGKRLDEDAPGQALGMAIIRDLVGLYGGDVVLDQSKLGGLKVELTLPKSR
ncbi:MAG: ATP-binding protein [Pseudomonadota bacterium]